MYLPIYRNFAGCNCSPHNFTLGPYYAAYYSKFGDGYTLTDDLRKHPWTMDGSFYCRSDAYVPRGCESRFVCLDFHNVQRELSRIIPFGEVVLFDDELPDSLKYKIDPIVIDLTIKTQKRRSKKSRRRSIKKKPLKLLKSNSKKSQSKSNSNVPNESNFLVDDNLPSTSTLIPLRRSSRKREAVSYKNPLKKVDRNKRLPRKPRDDRLSMRTPSTAFANRLFLELPVLTDDDKFIESSLDTFNMQYPFLAFSKTWLAHNFQDFMQ